jgi:hypothetical protein
VNGYQQHNEPSDGGTLYANQGTQNIYQGTPEDHFQGGVDALKRRLYKQAVERFEEFLSTASDNRANGTAVHYPDDQFARAHVGAVLGLLAGNPPSYWAPEEVQRAENHLDNAMHGGGAGATVAQASVVWAIVKEDYYVADGMPRHPRPRTS